MNDRFGRTFEVGAQVTYPVRKGSSLTVVDGIITKITPSERRVTLTVRAMSWDGKLTTRNITEIQRVTLVRSAQQVHDLAEIDTACGVQ